MRFWFLPKCIIVNFYRVFLQGIQKLLKDAENERNFQNGALLLAKVTKNGITSSVSFNECCQNILPVVYQLIFMILYGQKIHGAASHTQSTKKSSQ